VVDLTAIRFLVEALTGWLNHEQKEVVAYLVEENSTLRAITRASETSSSIAYLRCGTRVCGGISH
jgi:hypothetical protein